MVIAAALLATAAIPQAPVAVRDIVETREISGVSISPDGNWVAYRVAEPSITLNRVTLAWYLVAAGGGPPRRVADGGAARFDFAGVIEEEAPVWDADSRGFHFLAMRDGAVGLWSWREGDIASLVLLEAADIIDLKASSDGQELVYRIGAPRDAIAAAERQAYAEGVLVDASIDLMQPVAGGAIVDGQRVMQRLPGPWFERTRMLAAHPVTEKQMQPPRPVAVAERDAGRPGQVARRPTPTAGKKSAEILRRDGIRRVRITGDDDRSFDCKEGACASSRLLGVAWRPQSDELILREAGLGSAEQLWRLRPGDRAPAPLAATDGAAASATRPPRCAFGAAFIACAEASAVAPPTLVRIDYATGEKSVLAEPNRDLRQRIATHVRPLDWRGPDGTLFTGQLLSRAAHPQKTALVIQYYHCDGFLKGGVGDELPMIPLTEAGISVLCIRKAHAPDGEPTHREYDLALSGIGVAIDRLAADGTIDPQRVGIGGLSFGSQVALWGVRKSRRFAAATLASGQFEPAFYWAYALPGSGVPNMLKQYWQLGDPDSDTAGWRRLSAISDIDAIDTPLLMQLPEPEARLVVEFHTRLKRAGKPVEFFVFADEPHIKTQPTHQFSANSRNLDWYNFWLLGREDPAPSKTVQYARWRSYRAGPSLPAPAP